MHVSLNCFLYQRVILSNISILWLFLFSRLTLEQWFLWTIRLIRVVLTITVKSKWVGNINLGYSKCDNEWRSFKLVFYTVFLRKKRFLTWRGNIQCVHRRWLAYAFNIYWRIWLRVVQRETSACKTPVNNNAIISIMSHLIPWKK